jgi:hypothetical protein
MEVELISNSVIDREYKGSIYMYPTELIEGVLAQFGPKSDEYDAALNGRYTLGPMIEEYLTNDTISSDEFIIAYEQGDEELWRYYQMFTLNEPYKVLYDQWLAVMHNEEVELLEEDYAD